MSSDYRAPRNELEAAIARIWCEVLELDSVGIDDDFFDLGGHSLLAVALASEMSDLLGIDFHVDVIQEHPTVAGQAEAIAAALAAAGGAGDPE